MTRFFSEKLKVISFLSIIMVMYIHVGFPEHVEQTMSVPVAIRTGLVEIFCQCAVPMFFAISGYLFFYGVERGMPDVMRKMKKRGRTLVVPYVIAAFYPPLFFLLMEFVPGLSAHINSDSVITTATSMPLSRLIQYLFFGLNGKEPWAYHLWFLRDLILIVALTPLLYYLRKWKGRWAVLIVLLVHVVFIKFHFLYSVFWFVSGCLLLNQLEKIPRRIVWLMFAVFVGVSAYEHFYAADWEYWKYLNTLLQAMGVISLWCIYDILVPKTFLLCSKPRLQLACGFTFFIYLYHEPAIHIIVKLFPMILGESSLIYSLCFLLSPLLFLPVIIGVGYGLRRYLPSVYGVLAGGR